MKKPKSKTIIFRVCLACGKAMRLRPSDLARRVTHGRRCQRLLRTADGFWRQVKKASADACWPWVGLFRRTRKEAYGTAARENGQYVRAHRRAFELANGAPPPDDLLVLHRCDNPPCCNPAHLFLGTAKDNTRDMMRKGRNRYNPRRGEASWSARLTEADVVAIRKARAAGTANEELAAVYGVAKRTISSVATGSSWKHAGGPITNHSNKRSVLAAWQTS